MGQSPQATIFFGYAWNEEAAPFEDEDGDEKEWEELLANKRGQHSPFEQFDEEAASKLPYAQYRAAGDAFTAEHRAELDAWYQLLRDIKAEYGVDIGWSGSDEYHVPYIYVTGEAFIVSDYGTEPLPPRDYTVSPDEYKEKVLKFATDLEIDLDDTRGPGWFLATYYG